MNENKSQELFLLISKHDRMDMERQRACLSAESNYPYFYLLNWNFKNEPTLQRKVALQSPFRSQYYFAITDAPLASVYSNAGDLTSSESQQEIIDKFILNQPTIARLKKSNDESEPISDLAEIPFSPPISETFALILIKQGKISLAIDIYTKLMLSKPEKRLYFATQISELTNKINQN